jgi:L-2-hydroxyglutarate oxidase LhgO
MRIEYDVIIAGGGIIGLAVARSLLLNEPKLRVLVAEKEPMLGAHASGRNSGVLHAGFYYSPDSLKAKFCREGNLEIRKLADRHGIPVRDVGKVVVAKNSEELARLEVLFRRGLENGVKLEFRDAQNLSNLEPLAQTHGAFLWSPNTGVSDPARIINALASEVKELGGEIRLGAVVQVLSEQLLTINKEVLKTSHFVNATGSQSDRIAHSLHLGLEYSMIPFMGVYLAAQEFHLPLKRLVYPVPHPLNPFLGVHFTLTSDYKVKIGPSAIPILGREQYALMNGCSLSDMKSSILGLSTMLRHGAHDLPALIRSEWPKILRSTLVREAATLVPSVTNVGGWKRRPPGIRSQLIHRQTGVLHQDFIVEQSTHSTHVLNAVSPGWTSAIPFGEHLSKLVLSKL